MSFELVAMTSFDTERPIRVANHPARTSPKLPGFIIRALPPAGAITLLGTCLWALQI